MSSRPFPLSAIQGQDRLKAALMLVAVDPRLGGVLLRGEKGTAKTAATRALPGLLPTVEVVEGCVFNREPGPNPSGRVIRRAPILAEVTPAVSLERVVGRLEAEAGRRFGLAALQPGILARAHRGILYLERVNLIPEPILDAILTAHESGENQVEDEGVVVSHPCRFLLVASMNPQDGELKPHFLDRFAVSVLIDKVRDASVRADILHRCLEFERDPSHFLRFFNAEEARLARKIESAREMLSEVSYTREMLELAASIAISVEAPGHRADLAMIKVARVLAALEELTEVGPPHIQSAASLVLPHRMVAGGQSDEQALSEDFRREYFAPQG